MKVIFPVESAEGLSSQLHGHFGSAPAFLVVDAERKTVAAQPGGLPHVQGQCQPDLILGKLGVEAAVVGGIGGGALAALLRAGVKVYQGLAGSVAENLDLLKRGQLPELQPGQTCGHDHHHGHDHGGPGGCPHHG